MIAPNDPFDAIMNMIFTPAQRIDRLAKGRNLDMDRLHALMRLSYNIKCSEQPGLVIDALSRAHWHKSIFPSQYIREVSVHWPRSSRHGIRVLENMATKEPDNMLEVIKRSSIVDEIGTIGKEAFDEDKQFAVDALLRLKDVFKKQSSIWKCAQKINYNIRQIGVPKPEAVPS